MTTTLQHFANHLTLIGTINPVTIILTLVPLTLAALYYFLIYLKFNEPKLNHLPKPPNYLQFWISDFWNNMNGNARFYLDLAKAHGPVIYGGANQVYVNHSNFRKWLLTYKYKKSPEYDLFQMTKPTVFSTTDKSIHAFRKKLIAPAFSNRKLAEMEKVIREVAPESLVNYIKSQLVESNGEKSKVLDTYSLFHRATLDVIGVLVMGTRFNCINDKAKADYFLTKLSQTQMLLFLRILFPILTMKNLQIHDCFKPIVMESLEKRLSGEERHEDILQSLVDAHDPETGARLTPEDIWNECVTLLFAGEDTTSNTLTWTLYEILKNPEVYNLVESEILETFKDGEQITVEACKSKCKYLDAAILESMRFHPVGGGIVPRVVPKGGVTVEGHFIPEDTTVNLSIYAQHHDPDLWEHPEKFDIHRWLGDSRETLKGQMLGFSLGPRGCLGRDLAWAEIYLILAYLFKHFKMELSNPTTLTPKMYFIYKPYEELMNIKYTLRN